MAQPVPDPPAFLTKTLGQMIEELLDLADRHGPELPVYMAVPPVPVDRPAVYARAVFQILPGSYTSGVLLPPRVEIQGASWT